MSLGPCEMATQNSSKRQSQSSSLAATGCTCVEPSACQHATLETAEKDHSDSGNPGSDAWICRCCRAIDFESIFEDFRDPERPWTPREFDLAHLDGQSNCALCRFFYSVKEPPRDESVVDPIYSLVTHDTRSVFCTWDLPIEISPIFRVVPNYHWAVSYNQNSPGCIMELSQTQERFRSRQLQPRFDLPVIKEWLHFCDKNHKALCTQTAHPQLPQGFRVIDCITRKIILWEDIIGQREYVALSYVWGSTNQGSMFTKDVLSSPLPRTIEDTLLLATQLDYRYVWIDRYCIDQDNPTSKQSQIQSMDKIYQHSVLTVIAAVGTDPNHGLPGVGTVLRDLQPSVKVGNRSLVFAPFAKHEISSSKWNTRGWTYQEGLLSRRKLVVTTSQVYFQCDAMHCLESICAPLDLLHIDQNARMHDNLNISQAFAPHGLGQSPSDFTRRLYEYLQRDLTCESDILNAFKGVLSAFEWKFPAEWRTFCGIPIFKPGSLESEMDAFLLGLSWIPLDKSVRRPGFPSWTWLGWKTKDVYIPYIDNQRREVSVRDNGSTHARVEYADGSVLCWTEDSSLIFARDKSGVYPGILRLYGLTKDIKLSPEGKLLGDFEEDGFVKWLWVIEMADDEECAPYIIRQTRETFPSMYDDDCCLDFTLLVTRQWHEGVNILLLHQPKGSLCFERIERIAFRSPQGSTTRFTFPDDLKGWIPMEVRIS